MALATSKASENARSHRTPVLMSSSKKRPASPVSISEAAHLAGTEGSRKRRHVAVKEKGLTEEISSGRDWSQKKSQLFQMLNPASPSIVRSDQNNGRSTRARRSRGSGNYETNTQRVGTKSPTQVIETGPQILSPRSEVPGTTSFQDGDMIKPELDDLRNAQGHLLWGEDVSGSFTTAYGTSIGSTGLSASQSSETRARPRPPILNTTAAQDISLPSPSLSPVTAAANLQHRRSYFEDHSHEQIPLKTEILPDRQRQQIMGSRCLRRGFSDSQDSDVSRVASHMSDEDSSISNQQLSAPSMMSIPTMLDSFEAMPAEMKTYIMYQMLRRCSKPVLHFVADVVNPALKCDFLSLLPLELSLNIVGHFDLKTLCHAAQVSKKWRQIIDSDEKAWKLLFDADGYALSEGELERAIREGWGWQYASRPDDWEKDFGLSSLGVPNLVPSDTERSVSSVSARVGAIGSLTAPASGVTTPLSIRRARRKPSSKFKPKSRKQQKRADPNRSTEAINDPDSWTGTSAADGPYAAAYAAAQAVPVPQTGLNNLHLFKSIYQRHHMIRKSWMQDDIEPRHIAFRAHQRHVVTCLQFDTDKILTGSDDNNINVYDTQTGALRARLKGHEGGVWALQYEGNVLVSGSTDRSVRVWDIEQGVCTQVFQGHTSTVRCLQILMPTPIKATDGKTTMMPKQPLIITGSRDSNLRVWKLPKPGDKAFFQNGLAPDEECPYFIRVLTGHNHSVRAIAAHGDTLVSGSYDYTVRVWKISTGETLHRLAGHAQKVYSVVLDHKRNRCISGSMDNLVKVWSLDTGSVLFNLEGHSSLVGLLDLQQDRLVSAAADSTLRIWDPENGHCKSILTAHTGAITCFQHDGQKVISGSDRTLKMWNVANGEFVRDLLTDLSGVWQVKFNERRCVAAVQRNNLTYIEVILDLMFINVIMLT